VTSVVIADSSPLIALERIGRLNVLPALFGTVVVPPAIAGEIAAKALLADWMIVQPLPDPLDVRLAESTLHAGEREAIGLALQMGVDRLILDDEAARRVALGFGLPVTGTLGVLILAKRAGIVGAVRPLLDALTTAEFRIDRRLRAWVLATADEDD
jgi:predicted nucleic acid-binding protein